MDVKGKVTDALSRHFQPDKLLLENGNGVSGFVISDAFVGLDSIDRQKRIFTALRDPESHLSPAEMRQVLGIAALTVAEYLALGLDSGKRVKVSRVKKTDHPGQPSRKPSKDKP